jgi:hypothetical protein
MSTLTITKVKDGFNTDQYTIAYASLTVGTTTATTMSKQKHYLMQFLEHNADVQG